MHRNDREQGSGNRFRSASWFDRPGDLDMTALYIERYMNVGISLKELQSGVDEHSILAIRGTGPVGYPGRAEVVNMRPSAASIRAGVHNLPCIGDGCQSGTGGSPSILNCAPEAAVGGGLALLRTGDRVRVDLLAPDDEIARRREDRAAVEARMTPASQTVAGNPALAGWPVRYRRGARKRGEVSADCPARAAARQPLTTGRAVCGYGRWRQRCWP